MSGVLIFLAANGNPLWSQYTDGTGRYAFNRSGGADYSLTLYLANHTFAPATKTFVNLNSDQNFDFTMNPYYTVAGRVTDSNGSPLVGVDVWITDAETRVGGPFSTDNDGRYSRSFASAGSSYELRPQKANYAFVPAMQVISSIDSSKTVDFQASIIDPLGLPSVFITQQYRDFLNREPDPSGLQFWINEIVFCGPYSAQCVADKRVTVSAAFFLSTEFQQTGYLVERIYKTAYGDGAGTSTVNGPHQLPVPIIRFAEFLPDTQKIGQSVVVGQAGWEQQLENNKQAFTTEFMQRERFTTAFPTSMTPAQFVDTLFTNNGVTPSASERADAINEFRSATTSADTSARARALRRVAENSTLTQQEFNRAFVLMQYFGYLRRNPNDGSDTDYSGYDFWLSKLNQFNGNYVTAEMVKAFITAAEYRQRFGS